MNNPHNLPIGDDGQPWPGLYYAIWNPDGGMTFISKAQAQEFEQDPRAFMKRYFDFDIDRHFPQRPRRSRF
jgi:hypothetical protein